MFLRRYILLIISKGYIICMSLTAGMRAGGCIPSMERIREAAVINTNWQRVIRLCSIIPVNIKLGPFKLTGAGELGRRSGCEWFR